MRVRAVVRHKVRRRLLGLIAAPILVSQCAPTQCTPAPAPAPPPVSTTLPPPPPPPPPAATTTTTLPPPPTSTSYAFLASNGSGQYTRWSPCKNPIRWQLDTTIAPTPEFRTAVADALATAAAATGHSFELVGDAGPALGVGVEAVIGLRDLNAGTLGLGGGRFTSSLEMVTGSVYIDIGLTSGSRAATLRTTLIHEIGHMLGLGHVPDSTQVMFGTLRTPPPQEYQWGDLEGLRLVGATQPCYAALRTRSADEPTTEIILE